ncbi:MAG: hypothetical protein ACI9PP_000773 [Halobacteriales archaeon]|jgi:hypothetical protein
MGRTNPTFRDLLGRIEDRWGDYRRALRRDVRPAFDRLFEYGRRHADAAGVQNPRDPLQAVLLSIAIEQERRIDELESQVQRIDELEERIERLETADEE